IVKRPPERSEFSSPSNRIDVPGAPRTPASERGVPGGLVVTSAGTGLSFIHHSRYSPRNQNRFASCGKSYQPRKIPQQREHRQASQQSPQSSQLPAGEQTEWSTIGPITCGAPFVFGTGTRRGCPKTSGAAFGLPGGAFDSGWGRS